MRALFQKGVRLALQKGLSVGVELWDSVPSGLWAGQRAASLSLLLLFGEKETEFWGEKQKGRYKVGRAEWEDKPKKNNGRRMRVFKDNVKGQIFNDSLYLWRKDKDESQQSDRKSLHPQKLSSEAGFNGEEHKVLRWAYSTSKTELRNLRKKAQSVREHASATGEEILHPAICLFLNQTTAAPYIAHL